MVTARTEGVDSLHAGVHTTGMETQRTPEGRIAGVHCQQCGSTDGEDVGFAALQDGDGYTACCNERAIYGPCDPTDCYHLDAAR